MNEPVDFEKNKKSKTWIWVVAGIVVLCLCCVAAAIALFIAFRAPIQDYFSNITSSVEPMPPVYSEPTAIPSTPPASGNRPAPPDSVSVEPINPNSIPLGVYSLFELVQGWEGLSQPGENTWQVSFAYDQPIVIFTGWCTETQDLLDQNFEHIVFTLEVDGTDIPVDDLYWQDHPGNNGFCRSYFGLVQSWPLGDHFVVQTMTFNEPINAGWGDYPAGDYVDWLDITATP